MASSKLDWTKISSLVRFELHWAVMMDSTSNAVAIIYELRSPLDGYGVGLLLVHAVTIGYGFIVVGDSMKKKVEDTTLIFFFWPGVCKLLLN